jgi:arylsulfatase A-like enzyme
LRENTAIVVWGDHGYHLGEQSVWTKMTNFEHGTRVPLIVSLPGMKTSGQRTQALVELVDLYPTLGQICSLPLPAHLEGTSFAPLLEKPDLPWKKAAFSQYLRTGRPPFMGRSIRTERWRYTEWHDLKGKPAGIELYDETESKNLAEDPAHAERVKQLASQLRSGWQAAKP